MLFVPIVRYSDIREDIWIQVAGTGRLVVTRCHCFADTRRAFVSVRGRLEVEICWVG